MILYLWIMFNRLTILLASFLVVLSFNHEVKAVAGHNMTRLKTNLNPKKPKTTEKNYFIINFRLFSQSGFSVNRFRVSINDQVLPESYFGLNGDLMLDLDENGITMTERKAKLSNIEIKTRIDENFSFERVNTLKVEYMRTELSDEVVASQTRNFIARLPKNNGGGTEPPICEDGDDSCNEPEPNNPRTPVVFVNISELDSSSNGTLSTQANTYRLVVDHSNRYIPIQNSDDYERTIQPVLDGITLSSLNSSEKTVLNNANFVINFENGNYGNNNLNNNGDDFFKASYLFYPTSSLGTSKYIKAKVNLNKFLRQTGVNPRTENLDARDTDLFEIGTISTAPTAEASLSADRPILKPIIDGDDLKRINYVNGSAFTINTEFTTSKDLSNASITDINFLGAALGSSRSSSSQQIRLSTNTSDASFDLIDTNKYNLSIPISFNADETRNYLIKNNQILSSSDKAISVPYSVQIGSGNNGAYLVGDAFIQSTAVGVIDDPRIIESESSVKLNSKTNNLKFKITYSNTVAYDIDPLGLEVSLYAGSSLVGTANLNSFSSLGKGSSNEHKKTLKTEFSEFAGLDLSSVTRAEIEITRDSNYLSDLGYSTEAELGLDTSNQSASIKIK